MSSDNRDPVRVLGRVTQEQFDKWKAAAASMGITFTELAKTALDLHCQLIKIKLAEKPKEPRRKLPKQVHHKLPKKLSLKKENNMRRKGEIEPALLLVLAVVGLIVVVALGAWIVPQYNVWAAGKAGEATLMRAEQEKQIQIEQAKAELESSKLRAQAIETIGEMIQKYPEYREQEFIGAFGEAIKSGEIDQIIYVPTEANIPITESGRISRGEK